MASYSPFDCIIFDLDDTLYSSNIGFGDATKRNIDDFLVEKCGFEPRKASALRVQLFKTYGSTLAGLRALGYDVDADDYHSIVHGRLPYHLIKPDPQLRNLLLTISQRKIIFTNSDRTHAMKALNLLGIEDCFEQIICFETMNPNLFNSKSSSPQEFPVVLKPSLDAINIAIDVAEVDPCRTEMAELLVLIELSISTNSSVFKDMMHLSFQKEVDEEGAWQSYLQTWCAQIGN